MEWSKKDRYCSFTIRKTYHDLFGMMVKPDPWLHGLFTPQNTVKVNRSTAGRLIDNKWLFPHLRIKPVKTITHKHFAPFYAHRLTLSVSGAVRYRFLYLSSSLRTWGHERGMCSMRHRRLAYVGEKKKMSICKLTPSYFQTHTCPPLGHPRGPSCTYPRPSRVTH